MTQVAAAQTKRKKRPTAAYPQAALGAETKVTGLRQQLRAAVQELAESLTDETTKDTLHLGLYVNCRHLQRDLWDALNTQ